METNKEILMKLARELLGKDDNKVKGLERTRRYIKKARTE